MKKHGHYCKICGEYKANEKFSGKGHAAHICKSCAAMPVEERNLEMTLTHIMNLPWYLSKEQCAWLKKKCHDSRPLVSEVAQEAYASRFPFAERNEQKKRYHIDHLTLMVNDDLYDEYGDEIHLDAAFQVHRQDALIRMQENGQELSAHIPPEQMSKLLKWMVHHLEIFCWQQDYAPDAESELDDDEWEEIVIAPDETDATIRWQLDVAYRNGESQQIISRTSLPDRVEELVWELMDFLTPEDDLDE